MNTVRDITPLDLPELKTTYEKRLRVGSVCEAFAKLGDAFIERAERGTVTYWYLWVLFPDGSYMMQSIELSMILSARKIAEECHRKFMFRALSIAELKGSLS